MKLFTIKNLSGLALLSLAAICTPQLMAQTEEETPELPTPIEGIEVSGTLPVVYVNTADNAPIVDKELYLNASLWIDPKNTEFEPFGTEQEPVKLLIKGRGNSSWFGFGKKPYRLKFESKGTPLGMPKSKHFALLAHAPTQMQLTNRTCFELANLMELGWVPRAHPVEVVLNGTYIGVYSFSEIVKIDKNRLNIPEQADNNEDAETIPYGWVVEIDNNFDTPQIVVPQAFEDNPEGRVDQGLFTLKVPEELSTAQEEWITDQLTRLTKSFYNPDQSNAEWLEMIDLESMARYYIVQEVTGNFDAFVGSTYMHKGEGDKWFFGPIWDSEWSFVNANRTSNFWDERELSTGVPGRHIWIKQAMRNQTFLDEVKRIWNESYPEKVNKIYDFVDNFYNTTKTAFDQNALVWPSYNGITIDHAYNNIKTLLPNYIKWFDEYVNSPGFNSIEGIENAPVKEGEVWFGIDGRKYSKRPTEKGIYIYSLDGKTSKVVVR